MSTQRIRSRRGPSRIELLAQQPPRHWAGRLLVILLIIGAVILVNLPVGAASSSVVVSGVIYDPTPAEPDGA